MKASASAAGTFRRGPYKVLEITSASAVTGTRITNESRVRQSAASRHPERTEYARRCLVQARTRLSAKKLYSEKVNASVITHEKMNASAARLAVANAPVSQKAAFLPEMILPAIATATTPNASSRAWMMRIGVA